MAATMATIGPYEVIRPVAQGGMAEVYEVRDPASGERLALKLLQEARSSIKRFNREFEALTRLNHPGIVRVYRYGYHERQPWITMELLGGEVLQGWVRRLGDPGDPSRTAEVVRLAYLLCQGLGYVHDRGLVHRDLKSANVQVLPDGRVKLFDFGTAHLVDPLERITAPGDFIGTFSYAAPEQIVGQGVDHRSDLYSLGVLLYRLVSGRRPFKANDPQQVAQLHLHQTPRRLREILPELPEALDDLVARLLAKRRSERPQSADEVGRALEAIAGAPLALPGQGVAVQRTRSVGREHDHGAMWRQIEAGSGVRGFTVLGLDPAEQVVFAEQVAQDAGRRAWRGLVVVAPMDGGGGALRALAEALRGAAAAQETEIARQVGLALAAADRMPLDRLEQTLHLICPLLAQVWVAADRASTLVLARADHLDAGAARVLSTLAATLQQRGSQGVLVALAHRPAEVLEALEEAWPGCGERRLGPLDVVDTGLAVSELLHRRPPPPEAARRLHAASGGLPSLLPFVVDTMVAQRELEVRGDDLNRITWTPRASAPPDLREAPSDLRPLLEDVDDLLGRLSARGRRVLEVLALLGGEARVTHIGAALAWSPEEVAALASSLTDDGLVAWRKDGASPPGPQGTLSVPHGLIRQAVGDAVHPARRRLVAELLGPSLEALPPSVEVARLLFEVGRSGAALRVVVTAAARLLEGGAPSDALAMLEEFKPVAAHPGLDGWVRAQFELLFGRCVRAIRPVDPVGARSLRAAEALVTAPQERARVQLAWAGLYGALGHQGNVRKHLDAAWELARSVPPGPEAAEAAARLASHLLEEGRLEEAEPWLDQARWVAERAKVPVIDLLARLEVARLALARGRIAEAERLAAAALADATEPRARWEASALLGEIWRRQARFSEALALLEGALRQARQGGSSEGRHRLLLALGQLELDLCRLGSAQEIVEELQAGQARGERLPPRLAARLLAARIQLASGQIREAVDGAAEVAKQASQAGLARLAAAARAVQGEASVAAGEAEVGHELLGRAARALYALGDRVALADVVVGHARALAARVSPSALFEPVQGLLDEPGFRVLYLESALAELRWAKARGDVGAIGRHLREAQSVLQGIAGRQERTEASALRVHPWTREVRNAMARPAETG